MRHVRPPEPLPKDPGLRLFLAGSIEMGRAEPWQDRLLAVLAEIPGLIVLNPRRENWDPSWDQSAAHPGFREQVAWELDGLESADLVAMYLDPGTKSPISLLELGLTARERPMVVGCPPGFWRRGNVEMVCERFSIPLYPAFESFAEAVRAWLAHRTGTGLRAAPAASRELEELEREIASDPNEVRVQAYWQALYRTGLVAAEKFGFDLPEVLGGSWSGWRAELTLTRRSLESWARELAEPLQDVPLARRILLYRELDLDVPHLRATLAFRAVISSGDEDWGAHWVPPARLLERVQGFTYAVEVPLRAALADLQGWIRLETRCAFLRLTTRLGLGPG